MVPNTSSNESDTRRRLDGPPRSPDTLIEQESNPFEDPMMEEAAEPEPEPEPVELDLANWVIGSDHIRFGSIFGFDIFEYSSDQIRFGLGLISVL